MKTEFLSEQEYYEHVKKKVVDRCNLCRRCIEDCQIFHHTSLRDRDPKELQEKRIELLKDNKFSEEAYHFTLNCTRCGNCLRSCPFGLNMRLMNEILRVQLVNRFGVDITKGSTLSCSYLPDCKQNYFKVLASIQMKPSERRWFCEVPDNPRKADVVVFFSCQAIGMPDKIFTVVDILERMGIDFVSLGGVDFCSGYFYLAFGYVEESTREARRLIEAVESFKAKKLVVWCPATYYRMTQILPKFLPVPFQVQHVTQFMSDNMEKLEFPRPFNKTVTLHDSCNLGRMSGEFDAPRNILQSIPGVRLIEMEHVREEALCCGAAGTSHEPEAGKKLRTIRLNEAKDTRADVLIDICLTCHEFLGHEENKYPFEINNIFSFLGEALDIKYEEKLRKYVALKDINEVLDEVKDYIQESDFTIEEMRQLLPLYLGLKLS